VHELSQYEKDRIIQEENFRASIKDELESRKPKKSMTKWEFCNSSLGLLLISSVLISGFSALLTLGFGAWKNHTEKQRHMDRINGEIGYRASELLIFLDTVSEDADASVTDGTLKEPHTKKEIKDTLNSFINGQPPNIASLYPEFEKSSILQLATDLSQTDHSKGLTEAIKEMGAFLLLEEDAYTNPIELASRIQNNLNHYPEWRKSSFYYTDCTIQNPFCRLKSASKTAFKPQHPLNTETPYAR
jgi:hypothetical protein